MPLRWTNKQEIFLKKQLEELYVKRNLTIAQIGQRLNIADQTVFQRLQRLGIPTNPKAKPSAIGKQRTDIRIPKSKNADLAEFIGIMLGDGKLSYFQVAVTLGSKEESYAQYVVELIWKIFNVRPKIAIRKNGFRDVYLGSVELTKWLREQGLVYNKVLFQVDVPRWIFKKPEFMKRFLRGFFDTDGSIYKLRWGCQISFCNRAMPLLKSARNMLLYLGYSASRISGSNLYITKRVDVSRFWREIKPQNPKHQLRFAGFLK
jgi:DNA-binding transcriptional regulator WhiA